MAIDCGCATFAEVKKRGPDFWDEFELYFCDLLVGTVMNTAIVALMAPAASLGAAKEKRANSAQPLGFCLLSAYVKESTCAHAGMCMNACWLASKLLLH